MQTAEGASARRALACKILGIRSPQPEGAPLRVLDIARDGRGGREVVTVSLAGAGWESAVTLSERDDARPAYARARYLDLRYRGEALPPLVAGLLDHLERRLKSVTMATLLALVPPNPSPAPSGGEGEGGDPEGDEVDLHRGLQESWGHPDRWRVFLLSSELKRARDSAVQVDLPWVSIEHGDFECQFVGIGDFLTLPWRSPLLRGSHNPAAHQRAPGDRAQGEGAPRAPHQEGLSLVTDLHDMDVIGGGTERLAELLETLREEQRVPPELIQLNCTCVPLMNGDDVDHLVDQEREKAKFPIIYKAQLDVHPYGAHISAMRERLLAAPEVEVDPAALNLVGFPEGDGLDDLLAHLAGFGALVNRRVVPRMAPPMMDGYRRAAAQIMLENADWQGMVDYCFADLSPMRTLRLPGPFGLGPSIAWLEGAAAALHERPEIASRARAQLAALSERLGAELAGLAEEAGALGFGLVIEPRDLPRFTDPSRLFALPLLPFVEELGLRLRVALFDDGASARDEVAAGLRATVAAPERLDISWFSDQAGLDTWLRDGRLDFVYSDLRYDHRITAAGKAPVSSHVFEMGPEGALRTARRLLLLGRSPFYRRFGRYLGRERPRPSATLAALVLD